MRPVPHKTDKSRQENTAYRVREHLTEGEIDKLLAALKRNRHGHRDWLIGLLIYRHGLRVSEACDLRWDDIDLRKRTVIVRRLKRLTSVVGINLSATLDIISVKRCSFTEGDDETNSSLHTNIAHVTVHSSVSMWDTAQSVAL
jgi:integrase